MKTLTPLVLGALLSGAVVYIESRLDPSTRRPALDAAPTMGQPALAPITPSGPSPAAANLELTPEEHALADPEAVLDRLSQVSPAASRRKLALAVLDALGNSDAAIARVASMLPAQDRVSFRIDALALRADTDAPGAIRGALAFATSAARQLALARLAEVTTSRDASIALAQVALIDDPELKTAYLAQVAGTWASLEPEAALAWLETNVPAALPADAAAAALDAIAASDAQMLLENLGRFSATLQPPARKSALVALVAHDPQAAIAELALVGPGNDRRNLERAFGETYALENPEAALEWAQTLGDSRRALEGVFRGAALVDYEAAVDLAMDTFVAGREQALDANSTPIIVSINGLMDSGAGDFGKVMDGLLAADFPERTDTVNTMLVRWPQFDGAAALDWALDNDNLTRIDRSLSTFPAGYAARTSPELALAALDRVPSAFREDWVRTIGAGMAAVDIDGALAFLDARRNEPGFLPAMGFVAERLGATDPAAGAAILARFDDPAVVSHTLPFVSSWASHDPAGAAKWALSIEDPQRRMDAVRNVVSSWANADPDATLDWLLDLSDDSLRDRGLGVYLSTTAATGSFDAQTLRAIGPTNRERAAMGAILTIGRSDPERAQRLIDEHIRTPALLEEVTRQLGQQVGGRAGLILNALDLPR